MYACFGISDRYRLSCPSTCEIILKDQRSKQHVSTAKVHREVTKPIGHKTKTVVLEPEVTKKSPIKLRYSSTVLEYHHECHVLSHADIIHRKCIYPGNQWSLTVPSLSVDRRPTAMCSADGAVRTWRFCLDAESKHKNCNTTALSSLSIPKRLVLPLLLPPPLYKHLLINPSL